MNRMALVFRAMMWIASVRRRVGPERFDRVAGFLIRQRRRLRWIATAIIVTGPPALAIHFRVFGLIPAGPHPPPIIEHEFFVGTVVPVILIWIGILWLGCAAASLVNR